MARQSSAKASTAVRIRSGPLFLSKLNFINHILHSHFLRPEYNSFERWILIIILKKIYFILNTGSPHYVKPTAEVKEMDIVSIGRDIRNSHRFAKEGINVNFVEELAPDEIFVRTYERGVEDETLSCGTGVTASALVSAHNDYGFNRVEVHTPGGRLSVEFDKMDDDHYKNIWLSGPADMVYKGEILV